MKLRLNPHGVFGIIAVIVMILIAFFLGWNIIWWYFVIAILLYASAIIVLTLNQERLRRDLEKDKKALQSLQQGQPPQQPGYQQPYATYVPTPQAYDSGKGIQARIDAHNDKLFLILRLLLGCHIGFLFLAAGMLLNPRQPGIQAGLFLACVGGGLVIPFMLLRHEP